MSRLGCSTISFRRRSLPQALGAIRRLGLSGIDLGGLPGVCDHVPTPLTGSTAEIERTLDTAGVRTWALNVDPGPLNDPALDDDLLRRQGVVLADLAARLDAALIVPCGAQRREPFVDEGADLVRMANALHTLGEITGDRGVRLLVEGLHHFRFCHNAQRAAALLEHVPDEVVGFVLDVSHVVAGGIDEVAFTRDFASRIEHVHLRDAVPNDINLSLGRGRADFPGVIRELSAHRYTGRYVLELETHDVSEDERETVAAQARDLIAPLIPE